MAHMCQACTSVDAHKQQDAMAMAVWLSAVSPRASSGTALDQSARIVFAARLDVSRCAETGGGLPP